MTELIAGQRYGEPGRKTRDLLLMWLNPRSGRRYGSAALQQPGGPQTASASVRPDDRVHGRTAAELPGPCQVSGLAGR